MTTYPALTASWQALRTAADDILRRDADAAQAEIARRRSRAAAQLASSRSNFINAAAAVVAGAGNPVAAALAVAAGVRMAQARGASNELEADIRQLQASANVEQAGVRELLNRLGHLYTTDFAKGGGTPDRFNALSTRWTSISRQVASLRTEMEAHGSQAAWAAAFSSSNYEQAVVPQLAALGELDQVASNNATVANGVSTLQQAIYAATIVTNNAARETIRAEGSASVAMTSSGMFYHGTMTVRVTLEKLLNWIRVGEAISWRIPSFQLTADLAITLGSVTALEGGWPDRTTGAPTGAAEANVAQVDRRRFDVAAETTRASGDHLTL